MNTTYPTTTVEDTFMTRQTIADTNEKLTMAKEAFVYRDQHIDHIANYWGNTDTIKHLNMLDASRELYERDIAGIKSKYKSL